MSIEIYCDLKLLRDVIKENNIPTLNSVWWKQPCGSSSRRVGELQKHKILGLFLWLNENGVRSVTTNQIEEQFQKFFMDISRSTISLYLNQLTKEKVLQKMKKGKEVFYSLAHELPMLPVTNSFWVVRNFCIFPSYLCRTAFFARKLKFGMKESERNLILQLVLQNLVKNRVDKCMICQFCEDEKVEKENDQLKVDLSGINDLIPREIELYLDKLSELKVFNGESADEIKWPTITGKIMYFAEKWKKDIKFLSSLQAKKASSVSD
ncbi:MAG: hypothetical protein ACTSRW_11865 [Candidatus Helarchaeota archaeon]